MTLTRKHSANMGENPDTSSSSPQLMKKTSKPKNQAPTTIVGKFSEALVC